MWDFQRIRAAIYRGGTSKAIFLKENELPTNPLVRDQVILSVFGSPDKRQIDGLGGADSLTSKLAIIGPPSRPDADVDYTFGQVSIETSVVDYKGNCGNISSAVGPYAIDEGFVRAKMPETIVKIHNTNTGKMIIATVPVQHGKPKTEGNFHIDGVPGTGERILLNFQNSEGSVTGQLFPTGQTREVITLSSNKEYEVSIVDAANPVVFVKADALGFTGKERPEECNSNETFLTLIEEIRSIAAEKIGVVPYRDQATLQSPAVPKVAFVAPALSYQTSDGREISQDEIDLTARIMSMQKMHKAYAITGGLCTAVAASISDTVVHDVVSPQAVETGVVRLGHPSGILEFELNILGENGRIRLEKAAVTRTARKIMDGMVYVPRKIYWGQSSSHNFNS